MQRLHIPFSVTNLPNKKKFITLLKSPHVNKKAREQFEHITYQKMISIKLNFNFKLIKILTLNKPKNIKLKLNLV